jgi:hypothetical protein
VHAICAGPDQLDFTGDELLPHAFTLSPR